MSLHGRHKVVTQAGFELVAFLPHLLYNLTYYSMPPCGPAFCHHYQLLWTLPNIQSPSSSVSFPDFPTLWSWFSLLIFFSHAVISIACFSQAPLINFFHNEGCIRGLSIEQTSSSLKMLVLVRGALDGLFWRVLFGKNPRNWGISAESPSGNSGPGGGSLQPSYFATLNLQAQTAWLPWVQPQELFLSP